MIRQTATKNTQARSSQNLKTKVNIEASRRRSKPSINARKFFLLKIHAVTRRAHGASVTQRLTLDQGRWLWRRAKARAFKHEPSRRSARRVRVTKVNTSLKLATSSELIVLELPGCRYDKGTPGDCQPNGETIRVDKLKATSDSATCQATRTVNKKCNKSKQEKQPKDRNSKEKKQKGNKLNWIKSADVVLKRCSSSLPF